MNDNPVYKQNPIDIFDSPELEVAQAIRANDVHQIEKLVRANSDIDLNVMGRQDITLLFWACAHRYPRTVEKLLDLGANPNVTMGKGEFESHIVAICAGGKIDESFELVLEYGGDPNGTISGTPAVFQTVYARRFDRLMLLLDKGANINAVDAQTNLSLMLFCAKLNLFEQVAYLIEKGADFNYKSKVGSNVPFQVQKRRGQLNVEAEKWRTKVEEMLIERGVKFPVPNPWEQKK
ncbi:MAG: hypothetical protein AAGJ18_04465 [Bacteroidota bacterium]